MVIQLISDRSEIRTHIYSYVCIFPITYAFFSAHYLQKSLSFHHLLQNVQEVENDMQNWIQDLLLMQIGTFFFFFCQWGLKEKDYIFRAILGLQQN